MTYTVAQAAKAIGKSKATVQRAIASGRISATRDTAGTFHIDPAELHRVFAVAPPHAAPHEAASDASRSDTVLQAKLDAAEARIIEMREAARLRDDVISDLRRRLDAEAEERRRLTMLLADQRTTPSTPVANPAPDPVPMRRSWWRWGRG